MAIASVAVLYLIAEAMKSGISPAPWQFLNGCTLIIINPSGDLSIIPRFLSLYKLSLSSLLFLVAGVGFDSLAVFEFADLNSVSFKFLGYIMRSLSLFPSASSHPNSPYFNTPDTTLEYEKVRGQTKARSIF